MTPRRSLLSGPVQYLKGVGPQRAERFERMGIRTGRDLLYHVPHRYEDATTVDSIASLRPGNDATVIGRVISKGVLQTRSQLRVFHAVVRDTTGLIECAWPGRPWLDRTVSKGDLLLVSGPVRFYHGRQIQPREHVVLARRGEELDRDVVETYDGSGSRGHLFPIYSATEGLTHRQVRAILQQNLGKLLSELEERDPLDEVWLRELSLPSLPEALRTLHVPEELEVVEPARRRLAYGELFFLQLLHARARARLKTSVPGIAFEAVPKLTSRFRAELPFELTASQERAWEEIEADMTRPVPMNRLLQGDVGSGKTVVAVLAMLKATEAEWQAAIMAPTELLAEQHHRTLSDLLRSIDMEPRLLTGSVTGRSREEVLEAVREGAARIVVGTHALIQEGVRFARLGLVVIDEQHRFGVEQRRLLRAAGTAADALVMSATPIPRSLALALYGDLDITVIDEMPPGRKPVITGIRGAKSRGKAFEFLRDQLSEGRQAYVVYPLVEESEQVEARAATVMYKELAESFSEFRLGLLHGRLSSKEKEGIMRRFLAGEIQMLVSTTVIEVGIDVPNASVMFIEDAERFGLAQLHQLRGRVGRGAEQSYCVAFHRGREPPERLEAFAATTDGFRLAEEDLRLRGQGDFFGKEQHGTPVLRFAQLERDSDLLRDAHRRARETVEQDPELSHPAHRKLRKELAERYGEREALYAVG